MLTNKRTRTITGKLEASTGNVFADLGFEEPEERLFKAELATNIAHVIRKKGWTTAQTAERMSINTTELSRLLRGELFCITAERLFIALNRLGHSVDVRISANERSPDKSFTRVSIR
jgi:predicted XRE-type DNA-binding protein